MKKSNIAIAFAGGVAVGVGVKMLTRPRTVVWDEVYELVPHSDRSNFINVEGARLHFQEFGDRTAPTLVLIHGYTASLFVWHKVAPLLADAGFHVIAVDLVGFGYSEKPRWFDYSIQSQARMVSRFMNRLGIGRATLVGSSYGGAVAATICLDYPEYVEKLVLIDAVINDEVLRHPILRLASIPGVGEVITPFLVDSRAMLRHRMKKTLSRSSRHLITQSRIANVRRPLSAADAHHSVLATSRAWDANRIEQDAHLINQPTLIIWGEEDQVVGINNGYKLHDSILHSRFVVLKNCGHVPAEEKSEMVAELVAEFCRDRKGRISERRAQGMRIAKPR
ncbi:MAG: alpha/beta hydrolase [Chloracidobacterium sp.]|nr:alpha/beta hydrolase [Chloracidobacterium sp.]